MSTSYRLVMLAYPAEYRSEHGAELVDTAVEMHPDGWSFRQSRSLLIGGLRTRASLATNNDPKQAWAAGLRLALWLRFAMAGSVLISYKLGATGDISYQDGAEWTQVGIMLLPVFLMMFTTRWPLALAGTLLAANFVYRSLTMPYGDLSLALPAAIAVCLAFWCLATLGDGRRVVRPFRGLLALAGFVALPLAMNRHGGELMSITLVLVLPSIGILLLRVDPRPFIAATFIFLWSMLTGFYFMWGASVATWQIVASFAIPIGLSITLLLLSRHGANRLQRSVTS